MIGQNDWPFPHVRETAAETGMRLTTVYGSAPNEGSTEQALNRILQNFKQVRLVLIEWKDYIVRLHETDD